MFQFYNPFFLPMYDVVQHAMLQGVGMVKAPKYITKAIRSKLKHDVDFYEAMENGLASKPYSNPWASHVRMINSLKRTTGEKALETLKLHHPVERLKDVYTLSWNTAWHLDETVRLMSYHALRDKGFSPRKAAQISAKFHADYASVPPKTRHFLNNIFFTPTFKIAMGKLYVDMVKGAIKPTTKTRRAYAKGLLYTFGIIQGFDTYMVSQGYDRDQWGRRYTRKIQTDEGEREIVITWSTPANMWHKYFFRTEQAREAGRDETLIKRFMEANSWEFHPVYRTGYDLLYAHKKNIYSRFDPNHKKLGKSLLYVTKEWLRLTNALGLDDPTSKAKKDKIILDREMGKLGHGLISIFAFTYTRGSPEQQQAYKVLNEWKAFRKEAQREKEIEPTKLEVFIKRLEKIINK
jgi:hypothetical protein